MQIIDTEWFGFNVYRSGYANREQKLPWVFDCSINLGLLLIKSETTDWQTVWQITWGDDWELKLIVWSPFAWLKFEWIRLEPSGFLVSNRSLTKIALLFQVLFLRVAFRYSSFGGFRSVNSYYP